MSPRRGLIVPSIAVIIVTGILLALGTWQVRRLAWKTELIATVDARIVKPPQPLPAKANWPGLDPEASDYLPVTVTGRFAGSREFDVFANLAEPKGKQGGVGWWAFAPFEMTGGGIVFINCGFVPERLKDPAAHAPVPSGEVTLSGILRRPEGRNPFTPSDDIAKNQWFTRDPLPMAAALGLKPDDVLPFYVDLAASATPPSGIPQAGETLVTFSNNHLGYALTWYGLAAACIAVYGTFVRRRLKADDEA